MELEAVVLAAGPGSRMLDLTRTRPKCLLPVGNHNLIWFSITGLRAAGILKITLLVPDTFEFEIKQYCHKKFTSFKDLELKFVSVPSKSDFGTAQSILLMKDMIMKDFIVYSCDTIIDPKALIDLVNYYRLHDPLMSMLLVDSPKYFKPRSVPGRREKEHYMRDIIATQPLDKFNIQINDKFSSSKLVFLHSERDLKYRLKLKCKELALHPSIGVYSGLLDSHIYIFKHQVLEFLELNADRVVLKAEIVPLLIAEQFSKINRRGADNMEDDDVNERRNTNKSDYEAELQETLDNFNPKKVVEYDRFQRVSLQPPSACHAVVVRDILAYRVNTLGSYLDSNREAKTILNLFDSKNFTTYKDSIIGENTTLGDKCTARRSSIGNSCKIGDKVKLVDCVIMDNVEVDSNTSLSECIIASNAKIGSRCDLKNSIVGYKQIVSGGKKSNSEVISDDDYVIDLCDPIIADDE